MHHDTTSQPVPTDTRARLVVSLMNAVPMVMILLPGAAGTAMAQPPPVALFTVSSVGPNGPGNNSSLSVPGISAGGDVVFNRADASGGAVWVNGARRLGPGDPVPGNPGWMFESDPINAPVSSGFILRSSGVPVVGGARNTATNELRYAWWVGASNTQVGHPKLCAPDGHIAMTVVPQTGPAVVLAGLPASLVTVARAGDQAPGMPAGHVFAQPAFQNELRPVAVNDRRNDRNDDLMNVIVQARTSAGNEFGYWQWSNRAPGSLRLILADNLPAPGLDAGRFVSGCGTTLLTRAAMNKAGLIAVIVNVSNPAGSVLYVGSAENLVPVEQTGVPSPTLVGGGSFTSLGGPQTNAVINNAGHVAFIGSATNPPRTGLWLRDPAITRPILLNGDPLPGVNGIITRVRRFFLNKFGHTASVVDLADGGTAVVVVDSTGFASTVLRTGDTLNNQTVTGIMLASDFPSADGFCVATDDGHPFAFNDSDQLALFVSTIDAAGAYQHIVRATATFSVNPPGDTDGDGLLDYWETNGIDSNNDGTIDLLLPGADPNHKDLYVEIDAMDGFAPEVATLDRLELAFAEVPNDLVHNPDGSDGITLHLELDETNLTVAPWAADPWPQFDEIKATHFGTQDQWMPTNPNRLAILAAKRKAYRYCIFAHSRGGTSESGRSEYWGDDLMITFGHDVWAGPTGNWTKPFYNEIPAGEILTRHQLTIASTLMHELGHTLGLGHGGRDHINYKPNYHSIMNYTWQIPIPVIAASFTLDYSHEAFATLNEDDLDESLGVGNHPGHQTLISRPGATPHLWMVAESGPIDLNGVNGAGDQHVVQDINRMRLSDPESPHEILYGHNDWSNLRYQRSHNWIDRVHVDLVAGDTGAEFEGDELNGEILDVLFAVTPVVLPEPFSLLQPASGQSGVATTITFDWSDSAGALTYDLVVADEPAFASPVISVSGLTASSYASAAGALSDCTQYYWRVIARTQSGQRNGSPDPAQFDTLRQPSCQAQLTGGAGQPGDAVVLNGQITNSGPCPTTYDWTLSQASGALAIAWTSPTTGQITIQPGQSGSIQAGALIPSPAQPFDAAVIAFQVRVSASDTCSTNANVTVAPPLHQFERISVASSGAQVFGESFWTAISGDGRYVAFSSRATTLVPSDTNNTSDVFIRDRQSATTTRVSVKTGGAQASGESYLSGMSADGRYVTFYSDAPDLVTGDTNGTYDVFVRDRQSGTTTRVSVATGGAQAVGGDSADSAISADGRFIAFYSYATNLVPGYSNGKAQIYVHDRQTGQTTAAQPVGNLNSFGPRISADGRYVAFRSGATNLVSGDSNGLADIFRYDRQTLEIRRISVASTGSQGTGGPCSRTAISADGRFVAFESEMTNLVAGDTNAVQDVFLRDTLANTTTRVSISTSGLQGNDDSSTPFVSADGRFVAFSSKATSLVAGDANATDDVFLRDRLTAQTTRLSIRSDGIEPSGLSTYPALSADMHFLALESLASNLVAGDTNANYDIFVRPLYLAPAVLGDFNGDGQVTAADTPGFINVLLGTSSDPSGVARADLNADGLVNGLDIRPFLVALGI